MTQTIDIDNMPAGREMDALVAERVMGWTWRAFVLAHAGGPVIRALCHPESWEASHCALATMNEPPDDAPGSVPDFSTDITVAWAVVERVGTQPCMAVWDRFELNINLGEPLHRKAMQDAALAICRAALKAVSQKEA